MMRPNEDFFEIIKQNCPNNNKIARVKREISRITPHFKSSDAENSTLRESIIRQGSRIFIIRFERELQKDSLTIFSFTAAKPVKTRIASLMARLTISIYYHFPQKGYTIFLDDASAKNSY